MFCVVGCLIFYIMVSVVCVFVFVLMMMLVCLFCCVDVRWCWVGMIWLGWMCYRGVMYCVLVCVGCWLLGCGCCVVCVIWVVLMLNVRCCCRVWWVVVMLLCCIGFVCWVC